MSYLFQNTPDDRPGPKLQTSHYAGTEHRPQCSVASVFGFSSTVWTLGFNPL